MGEALGRGHAGLGRQARVNVGGGGAVRASSHTGHDNVCLGLERNKVLVQGRQGVCSYVAVLGLTRLGRRGFLKEGQELQRLLLFLTQLLLV